MHIQQLLTAFGDARGLSGLALDDNGICRLVFDEKTTVDIETIDGTDLVFFHSEVGRIPLTDRESFYLKLLEANLFGKDTATSSLAVDAAEGSVVLWRCSEGEQLNLSNFEPTLLTFAERSSALKDKLVEWAKENSNNADMEDLVFATSTESIIPI